MALFSGQQRPFDACWHKRPVDQAEREQGGAGGIKTGMAAAEKHASSTYHALVPTLLLCTLRFCVNCLPGAKFPSLLELVVLLGCQAADKIVFK